MIQVPRCVALIPARAGSKRVPGKNIRPLMGHPLIAYTIAAAVQSEVFSAVIVSTESEEIASIARRYGAEIPFLRPVPYAADNSPDIEWIDYTLRRLAAQGQTYDCFSILRPTSPFRQAQTIQRAWTQFMTRQPVDSLRAVEKCQQHPGKMWVIDGPTMKPLLSGRETSLQTEAAQQKLRALTSLMHSTPYQALPEVYIQNASLEIAWSRVVWDTYTIAGQTIMPFITHGYEGLDINDSQDWWYAEHLISTAKAQLPSVPPANLTLMQGSYLTK